jgi:class 3 adenylate cyclase
MLNLFKPRPTIQNSVANLGQYGISALQQEQLAAFLTTTPARELFHANPRHIANQLGLTERATLKLLLAAVQEGVVKLHWDVQCPRCGSVKHRSDSLSDLHHEAQCMVCQNIFAQRLDDEVRVTFSLHPRLRKLPPTADDMDFRSQIDQNLGVVTGQSLLLLPEFQILFPQEKLLPDESLEVTRLALVFTDLAGSTALYAQRGDPRAYHLVRLHFDVLFAVADQHGGTVVKNIGDAIMAVFQSPAEALQAALAMQAGIGALNGRELLTADEALILKVGLHSGPCLSVTLNDRPDYFGTTVNVAARVQGLSAGCDVVFTNTIRHDNACQSLLANHPLETTSVLLKGIEGEVLVHRLTV